MEQSDKLNGKKNQGTKLGELKLKSKWLPLSQMFLYYLDNLPKDGPYYKFVCGILETTHIGIKEWAKKWENEYLGMNTVTEYEKGKKDGALEVIQKRLLK